MYVQNIPPSPEIWRLFWFLPGKAEKKACACFGEKKREKLTTWLKNQKRDGN
jgi:hypothetical protein